MSYMIIDGYQYDNGDMQVSTYDIYTYIKTYVPNFPKPVFFSYIPDSLPMIRWSISPCPLHDGSLQEAAKVKTLEVASLNDGQVRHFW